MMQQEKQKINRHWYQEPMVWLVILLPLSAVIAGLTTLYIAITHADSEVSKDYYQKGLDINQSIFQKKMAKNYGIAGTLNYDGTQLKLIFNSPQDGIKMPLNLNVNLDHPIDAEKDLKFTFNKNNSNVYTTKTSSIETGKWYLQIFPNSKKWLIQQSIILERNHPISFNAR